MAQSVKNLPAMWETGVQSLGWEDPMKGMATHSSIGEFHGQRSPVGYSPWGSQRVRHYWATNTLSGLWTVEKILDLELARPGLNPSWPSRSGNTPFFWGSNEMTCEVTRAVENPLTRSTEHWSPSFHWVHIVCCWHFICISFASQDRWAGSVLVLKVTKLSSRRLNT